MIVGPYHPQPWSPPPLEWHDVKLTHNHNDTRSIELLGLSVRPRNCLTYAGIDTLGKLCKCSPGGLFRIRSFGKKCLKEVQEKLAEIGMQLSEKQVLELDGWGRATTPPMPES